MPPSNCPGMGGSISSIMLKTSSTKGEVIFYYTKYPPARWFFYFENQKIISNRNLSPFSDHPLIQMCRKTRGSFTFVELVFNIIEEL